MERKKTLHWGLPIALMLPLSLIMAFFPLRGCRSFMDLWVYRILWPFARSCGQLWSAFPVSVGEIAAILLVIGTVCTLIAALVRAFKERSAACLLRRLGVLLALWLWVLAAFFWMWNAVYYASTFTQRSGLSVAPHTVEELAQVTEHFAQNAARLSTRITRDPDLHWDEDLDQCIERGPRVYEDLEELFPVLQMESVKVKPLLLSRLQSIFGFTGVYSPFTGEANINIDAPAVFIPSTIAHEMSHQRMVASEAEANFIGIAACITSDDVVFQYSGYLSGLTHLCNALYPAAPERWRSIVDTHFTREMATDWNDNQRYWQAMSSPLDEIGDQAYDAYLKGHGQTLGTRSYGACVDLLVSCWLPVVTGQA